MKQIMKIAVKVNVALVIVLAVSQMSCSRKTLAPTAAAITAATNGNNGPPPVGTVGVMNVNQILPAYMAVTNLSPMNFSGQYQNIAAFMPASGAITSVNSSMLLALTGFAGSVCQAWLVNEAAAEAATPGSSQANAGVLFSAGPAKLTPAVATTVVNQYSMLFYGRAPTAAESAILVQSISDASNEVTDSGSMGVQDVLLVPCTAILASPAFIAS